MKTMVGYTTLVDWRTFRAVGIAAGAVVLAGACGGTVNRDASGSGGVGGTGSGGRSGTQGTGGGTGGFGGIGGTSGYAAQAGAGGYGAQGCIDECGIDGALCCFEGAGCGFDGSSGTVSCNCTAGFWRCSISAGGAGGVAGAAGFGGGCTDVGCGPSGAPCCRERSGCAYAGTDYSCLCMGGRWQCTSSSGGVGGASGTCNVTTDCPSGLACCGGRCVNQLNDIYNCGPCGATCVGTHPFCSNGACSSFPPCSRPRLPMPSQFCCGDQQCTDGQLCCDVRGAGPAAALVCHTPTDAEPSCPLGCPLCL